jgi:guanosine-3',5'-bis(diphosphate) 3'-pyrophosphohydrolase
MAKPNPSWLNFVITGKARSQIRAFMKKAESSDLVILGYSILNKALKAFHIEPDSIKKKHWDKLLHDYHLKNKDEILIDIALLWWLINYLQLSVVNLVLDVKKSF